MKIGIFIHLFITELFSEFKEYINMVKNEFGEDVFILFTMNELDYYRNIGETIVKVAYPDSHIIYIENKGVDAYSFLKQIEFVRERNIRLDYILKLHTKTSIQNNLHTWRKQLIEPIVDPTNLKYIHHIMKKKEIGYIASQSCIFPRNFDLAFKSNLKGLYFITKLFPTISEDYIDFVAGTIFWINYKIVENAFTPALIQYLVKDMSIGKPPSNFNNTIHPEYVFERLITGPLCYNYENILVNNNKVDGLCNTDLGLHSPCNFTYHNPKNIVENIFPGEKTNLLKLISKK